MIRINEKFMDKEEFIQLCSDKEFIKAIDNIFIGVPIFIDFEPMICIEGCPRIIISIFNKEEYDKFVECGEIYNKLLSLEEMFCDQYGNFHIAFKLNANTDVTDVQLGDFVLVRNSWSENIGVVSSILEKDDQKIFGCSFLILNVDSRMESVITKEDYGGYHSGFAKKLTKEEACIRLEKQWEQNYQDYVENIKNNFKESLTSMKKFINELDPELLHIKENRILVDESSYDKKESFRRLKSELSINNKSCNNST